MKLFLNPVFLSCVFSWFFAQFIKTIINLCLRKIHSISVLFECLIWKTGGFPSSHTALVTSLCTSIAFRNGIDSDIFMLSACLMMITIRDALGVRRSNGIHARTINQMGRELSEKNIIKYKPIKEVLGHKPMEVVVGALLGFFIGLAFSTL
ncbi:divergent PAP2 family protein [Treponema sp.]|uniref:divergent PAP2 family protein n=1 Tax=Treponema sp. TaxID=166 RepID=UPI00298D71DC|nr:divergent PAP2 family protein [Treponema sp.]